MKKFSLLLVCLTANIMFAQTKKIAFLGQASVYNSNIPTANDGLTYDDDRAAAVWFIETFLPNHTNVSGSYLSFQDVAEGADLSSYDVIWIQSDGATYTDRLNEWPRGTTESNGDKHCVLRETGFEWNGQCSQLEDDFISKIRSFYQSGGDIFLGNFAGKALEVIGAFDGLNNPWEYRPNQLFGDTTANSANTAGVWGTNWGGPADSPLIANISTSTVSCTFTNQSIQFLGADTQKKNRACQYNLNWGRIYDDAGGASSTVAQRRTIFQNTLNANILLENCDGNEIQGAKFNPRQSGNGIIIWYGAGVYDWYAPGTGSNENVKKITEDALVNLLGDTPMLVTETNGKELNATIYPNPTTSIMNIKYNGLVTVEVYDTTGKKILTSESKIINTEKLSTGIYNVVITDKNSKQTKTTKLIKK